jgi:hypothetical protein
MFSGALDRAGSALRRGEQAHLRQLLLGSRTEAPCAICGHIFPQRFLWASHIKRRAVCDDVEKRDIPHVAMLACLFGCDALFEEGFVAVNDEGCIVVAKEPTLPDHLTERLAAIAGRQVVTGWPESARYFAWHYANMFRIPAA